MTKTEEKKEELVMNVVMGAFMATLIALCLLGIWVMEHLEKGGPTQWYHWVIGLFCLGAFLAEVGYVIFRR